MAANRIPLTALRTFEAAARLLSFKAAAEALRVTPASVSNQIRQLERDWGCALFVRKARQVELTEAGRQLAQACQSAFHTLQTAIDHIAPKEHLAVSLAVGPLFGSRFLSPRLAAFRAAHPDIALSLHHGQHINQPQQLTTDLAIDWGGGESGLGDWAGLHARRLLEVAYVPVMSPALLGQFAALETVADLAELPLVHQQNRDDWNAWFALCGNPNPVLARETVMADSNMAMQAAIDGHGVALGALPMVQADLQAGRLVCPFPAQLHPAQAYFLITQPQARVRPAVESVCAWLLAQATNANRATDSNATASATSTT